MTTDTNLQLRSTVTAAGVLDVTVAEGPMPEAGPDEVVVRVDATPINPSDLGMLLARADIGRAESGTAGVAQMQAPIPDAAMRAFAGRIDRPLACGFEGAGVVVTAGPSDSAQSLVGRRVAVYDLGMYGQYKAVPAAMCLPLDDDVTAEQGASCFVNPLTALGMLETMREEGHTALVNTAAASNLGQMIQRLCLADGVALVNVVRRQDHVDLLLGQGATWVCDMSLPSFEDDLTVALAETGATIAFDPIAGGKLVSTILSCMTRAASVGADTLKQVYVYGGLEPSPTVLDRSYGMMWSVGFWLMDNYIERTGPDKAERLRRRIAEEITTTFASHYTATISLADVADPATAASYSARATGGKYLVAPQQ